MTGVGTGTIYITGTLTGLAGGSKTINVGINLFNAISAETNITLSPGDNTITVPSGANGCLILPPAGNTVALTQKGAGADTGVAMSPSQPRMLTFASPAPASFIINAASGLTGSMDILFF